MPPEQDRWSLEPEPAAGMDFPDDGPVEIGGPSFYDLVAMLAEPVPIYLGDARLPDGQSATNLELARLYIDMLEILRQKTAGNLDRSGARIFGGPAVSFAGPLCAKDGLTAH